MLIINAFLVYITDDKTALNVHMVNYHDMIVVLNGLEENQMYGDGDPKDTHGYSHLSIQFQNYAVCFKYCTCFASQISWGF